jgi:hypothetical protein
MIEQVARSAVGPVNVVCKRRQDGRQRIGVADVEGGAAFRGAFNEQRDQKLLPARPEPIGKMSLGR